MPIQSRHQSLPQSPRHSQQETQSRHRRSHAKDDHNPQRYDPRQCSMAAKNRLSKNHSCSWAHPKVKDHGVTIAGSEGQRCIAIRTKPHVGVGSIARFRTLPGMSAYGPIASMAHSVLAVATCHLQTRAVQQRAPLLDHFVGAHKQRGWDG